MISFYDSEGNVPLHSAVHGGDIKAVELCLKSGAKISTQQHDLSTPVHNKIFIRQCVKFFHTHSMPSQIPNISQTLLGASGLCSGSDRHCEVDVRNATERKETQSCLHGHTKNDPVALRFDV